MFIDRQIIQSQKSNDGYHMEPHGNVKKANDRC